MSDHKIGPWLFEHWDGPLVVPRERVESFTGAGADGVGLIKVGRWGETFEVTLTSVWQVYRTAVQTLVRYQALIGTDPPQDVTWNGLPLKQMFRIRYWIEDVELVECQQCVRLFGPTYNFVPGTKLVTRWRLTPVEGGT